MTPGIVRFRRLALATAVTTLALVAAGGLVRASGSGLGCLDHWPRCRGGWVAPLEFHAVIEYAHRLLAAVVVGLAVLQAALAKRWAPDRPGLRRASWAAVLVVAGQAALGRSVVTEGLHAALVSAHFLLAMALVALSAGTAVASRAVVSRPVEPDRRRYRSAVASAGGILAVLVAGTLVRERGGGLAFHDWPLMSGRPIPVLVTLPATLQFAHRVLAALVFGHVVMLAVRSKPGGRAVHRTAVAIAVLYAAQILLGAANVFTRLAPVAVLGHVALGALVWAAAVTLVVLTRPRAAAQQEGSPGALSRVRAYAELTKPRIVLLLLITTVPTMILAARGLPSGWLVLATLVGGTMSAGGANAINQYLDRDIDERMARTSRRPLPARSISPAAALTFGVTLGVVAFAWLAVTVNMLSAMISAAALLFYVFVYTIWMKRSTPQNIVIGGAAGAAPVLVGWAAVTGTVGLPAWLLFAVVFLWTPPHFWALAMKYKDDYATAGVPMLPVVASARETTTQILLYSVQMAAVTLFLYPAARMGPVYLVAAAVLGAGFVWLAVRLWQAPSTGSAMRLFKYSINYLALLFAAVAVDRLVPGRWFG